VPLTKPTATSQSLSSASTASSASYSGVPKKPVGVAPLSSRPAAPTTSSSTTSRTAAQQIHQTSSPLKSQHRSLQKVTTNSALTTQPHHPQQHAIINLANPNLLGNQRNGGAQQHQLDATGKMGGPLVANLTKPGVNPSPSKIVRWNEVPVALKAENKPTAIRPTIGENYEIDR
jgi:hypothetical protein